MSRNARWWVALVVLAAILAHDSLMAGGAHAAAQVDDDARVHSAVHRVAIPAYGSGVSIDPVMRGPDQAAEAPHRTGCAVVRSASPPRDGGLDVITGLPLPTPAPAAAGASMAPITLVMPGQPPGVRRALLQVYRI